MSITTLLLAGGQSSRMGVPKAQLVRAGISLIRTVIDASPAGDVIVIGPTEFIDEGPRPVRIVREDPPGGGPIAGLAAGIAVVESELVQILTCDLPRAAEVVAALNSVEWPDQVDAIMPTDTEGWPQFLAGRYRAASLRDALVGDVRGVAVRRVLGSLRRLELPLPDALLTDLDDPTQAAEAGWTLP